MTFSWEERSLRLAVIVVLVIGSALVALLRAPGSSTRSFTASPAANISPADELTIAATGDSVLVGPLPREDAGLQALAAVLNGATIAVTNFELTALSAAPADEGDQPRWPSAPPSAATDLRALGFGAVSLANNHVSDYGLKGLAETRRLLDEAGLAHAGAGNSLDDARAATVIETPGGSVALIAIAASHSPMSRAAPARGEIKGRPGVNPLRYTRRVTVDPGVFALLKDSLTKGGLPESASTPAEGELNLFGTTLRRGDRTLVELIPDAGDIRGLVDSVARARRASSAVIVSVHAHEPSNLVDEVPDFLREVSRRAIDAGADIVVGHGPHRLRGIEVYKGKPILYSLGNFIFQDRKFLPAAADVFEDSSQSALSIITSAVDDGRPILDFEEDVWWESVVAHALFRKGQFVQLELHPIDLGVSQNKEVRGVPRPASPSTGARILARLQHLSSALGTTLDIRGDGVALLRP